MKLAGGEMGTTLSRKTLKTYRQILKESVKKLNTYGKQREIMGKRNSYSKIDPDDTLKAAYHVQLAVEGEYITGAGIFATTNDGTTLKPFPERLKQMRGTTYQKIVADAGYDSEVAKVEEVFTSKPFFDLLFRLRTRGSIRLRG
jgi:hypothetical protein